MQDRLLGIGHWLQVNGEAIYGTRFTGRPCQWSEGERPAQEYGEYKVKYNLMDRIGSGPREGKAVIQAFFTAKAGTVYAITPGWPGPRLALRGLECPDPPRTVTLLGYSAPLNAQFGNGTLTVVLPPYSTDSVPCQPAYTFRIPGANTTLER